MKVMVMYWLGLHPQDVPVAEMLGIVEHLEDIIQAHQEMTRDAVAAGVGKALEQIL